MADVETSDLTPRVALLLGAVGALILIGSALLILWLRPDTVHDRDLGRVLSPMAAPALQINPRADMDRFRAEEMRELSRYGWIDRDRGIVEIPIEAAMARVARDGLPGWPDSPQKVP